MVVAAATASCNGLLFFILVLSCLNDHVVSSFGTSIPMSKRPLSAISSIPFAKRTSLATLHAAGMGMAVTANKKKNKNGKNNKVKSTPFNANASLMRLEKKYEDLSKANAKAIHEDNDEIVTSEYVICARSTATTAISDWVPVAQLCTAQPLAHAEASDGAADANLQALVSQYCREIYEAATLGAPVFKSIPRNTIQYSIESLDSFHKHVYEAIVEGNSEKDETQVMTKADARTVLKLDADMNDMAVIKKAYRTLSFEFHPDRIDADSSKEQVQSASDDYARVKLAYETLSSGIRSSNGASWYESLGGRARTDFVGPLELLSLDKAKQFLCSSSHLDSAIVGLDPEMVQTFVVRNQVSTSS